MEERINTLKREALTFTSFSDQNLNKGKTYFRVLAMRYCSCFFFQISNACRFTVRLATSGVAISSKNELDILNLSLYQRPSRFKDERYAKRSKKIRKNREENKRKRKKYMTISRGTMPRTVLQKCVNNIQ